MRRLFLPIVALLCLVPVVTSAQLNVSIDTFDPGVPEDYSQHQDLLVFPKIREIESKFLPFVLRQALVETGDWGAVRVVLGSNDPAELLISGKILHSDGQTLHARIWAVDARGHEWLNNEYTSASDYRHLFDQFIIDLASLQDSFDERTLQTIVGASLMRYSAELAPDAFSDYIEQLPDGTFQLLRLPAEGDPMLERIRRIRSVEYVMTDSIDEKFRELHEEVDSVYAIWRKYRKWYNNFRTQEALRNQFADNDDPSGSYEAMRKAYDNYRLDRLAAQEQDKWIVGFNNEIEPVIRKMDLRIAEMNAWVENGYVEWTRILGELFELESGLD